MKTGLPAYVLSELGVVCALGCGMQQVYSRLIAGDQSGMVQRSDLMLNNETFVAAVDDADLVDDDFFDDHEQFQSRNNRLLITAFTQIANGLKAWQAKADSPLRIAIVLGTSTSGVAETEHALPAVQATQQWPDSYHYSKQEFGDPAKCLAAYLKAHDYGTVEVSYSISTACSSSAKVFGSARRLLATNVCDVVIVGGVDSLCRLTVNGFSALDSVSKGVCQPFGRDRDGINIGEAAALFLMSQTQEPDGEDICFLGIGESSDAHHISAPHPEGKGAIAAMERALADAGKAPEDVAYINLHGTATRQNDAMESKAVGAVLGTRVPASSTKSLTGHTLGAAGALEAAFCWLLLSSLNQNRALPPQVTGDIDYEMPEIAALPLVGKTDETLSLTDGVLMSNSFAFGGSNVSLVLGKGGLIRK